MDAALGPWVVMQKRPSDRIGFTLIELMIAVVVIGILAAIAVPKFNRTRRQAYVTTMQSDLRNLVSAQELFFADSARYATDPGRLVAHPSAGTTLTLATGPGYWSATATHAQVTDGLRCAIAVNVENPLVATAPDGQPVCR